MSARKKAIPAHVQQDVWRIYGAKVCWCCQTEQISAKNKHFGHIVAEANGGQATVDNLRPICPGCNLRMGTQNMLDYMTEQGYPLRDVAAIERVLAQDPGLVDAMRGRDLFVVPTLSETGIPIYDYVLKDKLLAKYTFLRRVAAAQRLGTLFASSDCRGITFHFIVRPEFVRWVRNKQEALLLEKEEQELCG